MLTNCVKKHDWWKPQGEGEGRKKEFFLPENRQYFWKHAVSMIRVNLWWPDSVQSASLIRIWYYIHRWSSDVCWRIMVKLSWFGDNLTTAAVFPYIRKHECACVDHLAFMSKSYLTQINILPPAPNVPSLTPMPWTSLAWKSRNVYQKGEGRFKPCLYCKIVNLIVLLRNLHLLWVLRTHNTMCSLVTNQQHCYQRHQTTRFWQCLIFWLSMNTATIFA